METSSAKKQLDLALSSRCIPFIVRLVVRTRQFETWWKRLVLLANSTATKCSSSSSSSSSNLDPRSLRTRSWKHDIHTTCLYLYTHQLKFIKMPAAKKKASSPQARKSKGKQRNEKLILGTVHGELVGTTRVDQKSRISQALVDEVIYKASCIEMFYTKTNGTDGSYYGQAGLIRGERLRTSPEGEPAPQRRHLNDHGPFPQSSNWVVAPVTALHNITDEGFTKKYQTIKMYTSTGPSATCTLTSVMVARHWGQLMSLSCCHQQTKTTNLLGNC